MHLCHFNRSSTPLYFRPKLYTLTNFNSSNSATRSYGHIRISLSYAFYQWSQKWNGACLISTGSKKTVHFKFLLGYCRVLIVKKLNSRWTINMNPEWLGFLYINGV